MLFNSYAFLFGFLPLTLALYFWLGRTSPRQAVLWLVAASIFFYGWWNPRYVALLIASAVFNYGAGRAIAQRDGQSRHPARLFLGAAVGANLLLLAVFKYYDFFVVNIDSVSNARLPLLHLVLPLGISFFTFTQIAFLVDVYRQEATEYTFLHYLLFVTYFPHLIAGPVIHHKQMMPQFALPSTYQLTLPHIRIGVLYLTIGLAKKVLLADYFAELASPVFSAVSFGAQPNLAVAWTGALAYTFQLYFDFSGYSDMAVGLSKLFNIDLPHNFNSPYKATSIIDFWRRWHMTLSRFLRDYLYIPLGGNRRGSVSRYVNVLVTMVLGGLWHGANWTFVIWGALHGSYLIINQGWRAARERFGLTEFLHVSPAAGRAFTFLAVIVGWAFFRADSVNSAGAMLRGMSGLNGLSLPPGLQAAAGDLAHWPVSMTFDGLFAFEDSTLSQKGALYVCSLLGSGLIGVWMLPNSREIDAALARLTIRTEPSVTWPRVAAVLGVVFAVSVLSMTRTSDFLYFQF